MPEPQNKKFKFFKIFFLCLAALAVFFVFVLNWISGSRWMSPKVPLSSEIDNPYNVVIITIDNLRADRLGCYGYQRPTSPNIDRFARQSMLFYRAFSTSSFTPPAHASLFTSKYVGDHGLLTWNRLPRRERTLAEVLKANGYKTVASVSLHLLLLQNLGQGFDIRRQGSFKDGHKIVEDALNIVTSAAECPFFLWLHFYDVHRPYGRHPDWMFRFSSEKFQGVGDRIKDYNLWSGEEYKDGNSLEDSGMNRDELQFLADRYDAGIGYVDSSMEILLNELSDPLRLKDTLVIITSDHGENLLEHRKCLFSHDPFLYSVVTRIPLLIRFPDAAGAGKTSQALVSLIDIAPTVMDTIGLPIPSSFKSGESLLPLLKGDPYWERKEVFMECWGWAHLKAARSAERLVIEDIEKQKVDFFDLVEDPEEIHPYSNPLDERDRRLLEKLNAFALERKHTKFLKKIRPETERRLKSLGSLK
jgi:arylsulfatase